MVIVNKSVCADHEKIDAVSKFGRSALSDAFKIGLDIYLGQYNENTNTVLDKLVDNFEKLKHEIDSQIDIIRSLQNVSTTQQAEIESIKPAQKIATKNKVHIDYVVAEFQRCIPIFINGNNPNIIGYMSELVDWTTNADVKKFISDISNTFDENGKQLYDMNNVDSEIIIKFLSKEL